MWERAPLLKNSIYKGPGAEMCLVLKIQKARKLELSEGGLLGVECRHS